MQYPLRLQFKLFSFSPKIVIKDASDHIIGVVKKRRFKLKEHILIYTDLKCDTLFADIKTNQILDWSALYSFTGADESSLGCVGREGMASLWKARYTVFETNEAKDIDFVIEEENPATKIMDSIFAEIPLIGLLSSYLFQPRYAAKPHGSEEKVMRLIKKGSFIDGRFLIERLSPNISQEKELRLIFSFLMLTILERRRG